MRPNHTKVLNIRAKYKNLGYFIKSEGSPCQQGERSDKTGCIPSEGEQGHPQPKTEETSKSSTLAGKPIKRPKSPKVEPLATGEEKTNLTEQDVQKVFKKLKRKGKLEVEGLGTIDPKWDLMESGSNIYVFKNGKRSDISEESIRDVFNGKSESLKIATPKSETTPKEIQKERSEQENKTQQEPNTAKEIPDNTPVNPTDIKRKVVPKVGYHVTDSVNLESILKNGLVANRPQMGSEGKAVYFSDHVANADTSAVGDAAVVLHVKIPPGSIAYDDSEIRDFNSNEGDPSKAGPNSAFYIPKDIPPEYIEVIGPGGKKKPLKQYVEEMKSKT